MLNRLSVFWRLVAGFIVLSLFGALIGAVGVVSTARMNDRAQVTHDQDLTGLNFATRVEASVGYASRAIEESILAPDAARRAALIEEARRHEGEARESLTRATPLFDHDQGHDLLALAQLQFGEYDRAFQSLAATVQDEGGRRDASTQLLFGSLRELGAAMTASMRALIEWKVSESKDNADQTAATFRSSTLAVAGLTLAAIVAALTLGVALAHSVSRPLRRAIDVTGAVAAGDLSAQIETRGSDELARLQAGLHEMVQGLRQLVSTVREGVGSVAVATGEIAAGNRDLSARTKDQADRLETAAASMEQLASTVKQNAEAARMASQLAVSASAVAGRSGEVVAEVVDTMGRIQESSRRIAEIIGVIDGIAFQTNILALNAAVEAARAGQQGLGFAVVAEEVRRLAQRSAQAAREIRDLITDSVNKAESGSLQVVDAGKTIQDVVVQVRRVEDILGEIASATSEQSSGVNLVNQSVARLDRVTQENATLVQQSATAAAGLNGQAEQLSQAVAAFKLGTTG